ncbi:MAG: hypothetical protein GXP56_16420 [Deltaproteobacteria bacterium]|nr:hypothetical protein [Deltaproteobacteria bacterium]
MAETNDIRDLAYLSESDIQKLNFVNASGSYFFRKYYRSGLRSHIFEVLAKNDVLKETRGEVIDGVRMFPRARPKKMFRILRKRFENKEKIFHEIERYHILLNFLGKDLIAESEEFIVDYTGTGESQILLCGLQEYIQGEILDPWRFFGDNYLKELFKSGTHRESKLLDLIQKARKNIAKFVKRIRSMIKETGYIPDLAGIGNLVLTPEGGLKLVDINNIVEIKFNDTIFIDDKGYPSCDVSVEVLSMLERNIFQNDLFMDDPLYRLFLSKKRKIKVKALEKEFYKNL